MKIPHITEMNVCKLQWEYGEIKNKGIVKLEIVVTAQSLWFS